VKTIRSILVPSIVMLAACSRSAAEHAEAPPAEESRRVEVARDAKPDTVLQDAEASPDRIRCASVIAAYEAERNRLFSGDRGTLRERLTEVGSVYREKISGIPGCSYSFP